jgi:chromosome segregation ATPase
VDLGPVIVGVFGGGALAALVAVLLKYRADNARTLAEASKTGAEGSATAGDALQRRYDALFDAQERELARLGADLGRARHGEAQALEKVNQLQAAFGNATAAVRVARDEVTRLQDRLDELERRP